MQNAEYQMSNAFDMWCWFQTILDFKFFSFSFLQKKTISLYLAKITTRVLEYITPTKNNKEANLRRLCCVCVCVCFRVYFFIASYIVHCTWDYHESDDLFGSVAIICQFAATPKHGL